MDVDVDFYRENSSPEVVFRLRSHHPTFPPHATRRNAHREGAAFRYKSMSP
jgi:hypothetical protein